MTIQDFHNNQPRNQLIKGEAYFRQKRVSGLVQKESGSWTASVLGREMYEVEISMHNVNISDVSCECVAHATNPYCKHVIAVLFAIQEQKGMLRVITATEFEDIVNTMPEKELRRFIIDQAGRDISLKSRFAVHKEVKENSNQVSVYSGLITHFIDTRVNAGKKISQAVLAEILEDVETLLEKADRALERKEYELVTDITLAVITTLPSARQYIIEGESAIKETVAEAFEVLMEVAESSLVDEETMTFIAEEAIRHSQDPAYPLPDYEIHWIDIAQAAAYTNEEHETLALEQLEALLKSAIQHKRTADVKRLTALKQDMPQFSDEVNEESSSPTDLDLVKQHIVTEMDNKNFEEAFRIAEEKIKFYTSQEMPVSARCIKDFHLEELRKTNNVLGLRNVVRQYYRESRDMEYFRILKATYVDFEWKPIAEKFILKLEKNIPLYAEGEGNPGELADVYLEELDYGDPVMKLMKEVKRLDFINTYANELDESFDNELVDLYRSTLEAYAVTGKAAETRVEFLLAMQKMMKLQGGKVAAKKVAEEINLRFNNLYDLLIPASVKSMEFKSGYSYELLTRLKDNTLLEKGKTAIESQQYGEAEEIVMAILSIAPDHPAKDTQQLNADKEAIEYVKKGFDLLLELCDEPLSKEMKTRIYNHAARNVLSSCFPLNVYPLHWIDVLMKVGMGKEKENLGCINTLLENKDNHDHTLRLLHMKVSLLKKLDQDDDIMQMLRENPALTGLRGMFIDEMTGAGKHSEAKELLESGMEMHKGQDPAGYRLFRDKRLSIARQERDTATIRSLAKEKFHETKDLQYYRLLKSTFDNDAWKDYTETAFIDPLKARIALKSITAENYVMQLASIYAEEKYWQPLVLLLSQYPDLALLKKYADMIGPHHTQEMLLIYSNALMDYAEKHTHIGATNEIFLCMKYMKSWKGGTAVVRTLVAAFRVKFPTRKKLIDVLKVLGV